MPLPFSLPQVLRHFFARKILRACIRLCNKTGAAVAEFKRNGNGTVEVKFVDRVKALSALYDMLGGGDADEAAEFLQALEQAGEEDDWRP